MKLEKVKNIRTINSTGMIGFEWDKIQGADCYMVGFNSVLPDGTPKILSNYIYQTERADITRYYEDRHFKPQVQYIATIIAKPANASDEASDPVYVEFRVENDVLQISTLPGKPAPQPIPAGLLPAPTPTPSPSQPQAALDITRLTRRITELEADSRRQTEQLKKQLDNLSAILSGVKAGDIAAISSNIKKETEELEKSKKELEKLSTLLNTIQSSVAEKATKKDLEDGMKKIEDAVKSTPPLPPAQKDRLVPTLIGILAIGILAIAIIGAVYLFKGSHQPPAVSSGGGPITVINANGAAETAALRMAEILSAERESNSKRELLEIRKELEAVKAKAEATAVDLLSTNGSRATVAKPSGFLVNGGITAGDHSIVKVGNGDIIITSAPPVITVVTQVVNQLPPPPPAPTAPAETSYYVVPGPNGGSIKGQVRLFGSEIHPYPGTAGGYGTSWPTFYAHSDYSWKSSSKFHQDRNGNGCVKVSGSWRKK